jgi:hypothetical protein
MSSFEKKTTKNGKKNPKYVDLLDEDTLTVAGQKFSCVSFISPENILKSRELFLFNEFVKQWDMSKSMSKFSEFINFLSFKYNLNVENVINDYNDFIKEEENTLKSESVQVENDWKNFLDKNEDRLNAQFNKENEFQTSVRGLKIRGSFPTQEEAEIHCKKLREYDPNHDIYVAPNGVWLPWEPSAYKLGKVEYLEPELNKLMQEKMENEIKAKQEFDKRVKETKRKAIEENVKKAQLSGNKLTQCLDAYGNLVGANTMNFDDREVSVPAEQERIFKETVDNAIEREKNKS